jgi:tRNA nucleotidyltransferase (CCA-adding enzyme)
MTARHWEHYPHEADMGIRGVGDSKDEAFAMAAMALTAIITDPGNVLDEIPVTISCDAADDELLLVDWLNAIIYKMATRRMLFSRFEVHISIHHLQAIAWGEQVNIDRHQPVVEVKGATYTDLHVYQTNKGQWLAQCVVDV